MTNGYGGLLTSLAHTSDAVSRSICAENFTGEKGKAAMAIPNGGPARDLGQGWKVSPSITVAPGEVRVLADIEGEGAIRHIWLTPLGIFRFSIIRFYWDDSDVPSVECPVGDFFAAAYQYKFKPVQSLAVCVNPKFGLNCYWEMPFKKRCRITLENIADKETVLYYQIDYVLQKQPDNIAYFHAQFRRSNPLPYKQMHTILEGASGKGHYVGTYLAWGLNNNGWWGEGEIKFYIDGDKEFPTICGTGTEDYFCGAYNFDIGAEEGGYYEFCTPYSGMHVIRPDGTYGANTRFSLYRWHITDPIYFGEDLKVAIQALGWRDGWRFLPLQDDISSVAFWYQDQPIKEIPKLPSREFLEII